MRVVFAMEETVMNRYSVEVPKELENASDDELLEWVNSGKVFDESIEFEKDIDIVESELATDYEFTVVR